MIKVQWDSGDLGYQKFDLVAWEEKLFNYCQSKEIDGIAYDKCFILSENLLKKDELSFLDKKNLYLVKKNDCKFENFTLLNKHKLIMGTYADSVRSAKSNKIFIDYLNEFKNVVLRTQLSWCVRILKIINSYLNNRKSAGTKLGHKEIIQVMLADAINHLKSAEHYLFISNNLSEKNIFEYQFMAAKELFLGAQSLGKLYGGRAFLRGNVIEMMMVFEYFRHIYFIKI